MPCINLSNDSELKLLAGKFKCLTFLYESDLSLVLRTGIPSNLNDALIAYITCVSEGNGQAEERVLYIVRGGSIVKCSGDDVNEVFSRILYKDKESLLLKRKSSSSKLSDLIKGVR